MAIWPVVSGGRFTGASGVPLLTLEAVPSLVPVLVAMTCTKMLDSGRQVRDRDLRD